MNNTPGRKKNGWMTMMYGCILVFYGVMITYWSLIASAIDTDLFAMFGFGQCRSAGFPGMIAVFALVAAVIFSPATVFNRCAALMLKLQDKLREIKWFPALFSFGSGMVFYLLRNNFLNSDGRSFAEKFQRLVPVKGALVTHDEILELYFHSRFWFYTNQWFDWTVPFSYQVLSCVAGVVFIFILIKLTQNLLPDHWLLLSCIIITGGYVQLFFGDVENYTITGALILLYFFASHQVIGQRWHVIWPSLILAMAMMFHLLAGFLLPSLLVLYFMELQKRQFRQVIFSAFAGAMLIAVILGIFHFNHLPLQELYTNSHAMGHGGHFGQMLVEPSMMYYMELFSLFVLLMPGAMLLLPNLLTCRIQWDAVNVHLGTASLVMVMFMIFWEAKLGVYNDWNLFANVAIPVMLLTGRNIVIYTQTQWQKRIITATILLMVFHSFCWIVGNHNL